MVNGKPTFGGREPGWWDREFLEDDLAYLMRVADFDFCVAVHVLGVLRGAKRTTAPLARGDVIPFPGRRDP